MQAAVAARLNRELPADTGLSVQDYASLATLIDQSGGWIRAFELARQLGWEKSRLSHYSARMVKRRLAT